MDGETRANAESTPGRADLSRSGRIISWMLLAGIVAVGAGAIPIAVLLSSAQILGGESGFEISDLIETLVPSIFVCMFAGTLHVTLLALLVFLPVRYAWKRAISKFWVSVLTAVAGGFVGALPWIIRLVAKFASGLTTITSNATGSDDWIMPAIYVVVGCTYGGLFGCTYTVIERRNGGLDLVTSAEPDEKVVQLSGLNSNSSVWWLSGVLLAVVLFFIWMFTTPLRMINAARRATVKHQSAIVAEAQKMLDEAHTAENGAISFDVASKRPLPEAFGKLGDVYIRTSNRYPGAVKVEVTGGFTHMGLFIVPKPTSATIPMLKDNVVHEDYGSLTIVNDQVFQYSEGY